MRISRLQTLIITTSVLAFTFVLGFTQNPALGQDYIDLGKERILSFKSDVVVQKNGDLEVTEAITVVANGTEIKRGIFRDFPTKYGIFEPRSEKGLKVTSVKKNGTSEPFHIENLSNGKRLYIGDSAVFLKEGVYVYEINYITTNQLGFFDEFDELYWNVTGNDWAFPIEHVAYSVTLPKEIDPSLVNTRDFVGLQGSTMTANSFKSVMTDINEHVVVDGEYTNRLVPKEGLTIAVNWPKGFVTEPPAYTRYLPPFVYSFSSVLGVLLFVGVFIYFYIEWRHTGRDENMPHTVPVHFAPPKGMTPAQVRYLDRMGKFDDICFSTSIMNLAIQGYITITDKVLNRYLLKITNKPTAVLVADEKVIYSYLFPSANSSEDPDLVQPLEPKEIKESHSIYQSILELFAKNKDKPGEFTISQENRTKLIALKTLVSNSLKNTTKSLIVENRRKLKYAAVPVILFVVLNGLFAVAGGEEEKAFFTLFSTFWTIITFSAVFSMHLSTASNAGKFFISAFMLPFIIVSFFTSMMAYGPLGGFFFVSTIIAIAGFYEALPRRTAKGREAQNEIDGFKMFIESQEEYIQGVEMSIPERFSMYERYLPYAIALSLEPKWSKKFKKVVEQYSQLQNNSSPAWYLGSGGFSNFSYSSFTSSLSKSVAAASTNPSSSSGSSGGSSGGGGGGGGGGGW